MPLTAKQKKAKQTKAQQQAAAAAAIAAKQPKFTHIHCSSRFDRSAAALEKDIDNWMDQCSIITMTEISNDGHAQKLQEQGWGYYNAKQTQGQDECAIAWRKDRWKRTAGGVMKLNNADYYRRDGRVADPVYSCDSVLKHTETGHKLLISVTHMPAHVEGRGGWRTTENKWQARKAAYMSSMTNWHTHILALDAKHKPDSTMVIADWNLNLKETWIRDYMKNVWTSRYKSAWVRFPTSGGSMSGGHPAPLGAPGKGYGDRIIDGTLIRGLSVDIEPNLMGVVASSDHRPYKEGFQFSAPAGHPTAEAGDDAAAGDDASGNIWYGEEWWGFGDYMDDEIYQINIVTGAPLGEVL